MTSAGRRRRRTSRGVDQAGSPLRLIVAFSAMIFIATACGGGRSATPYRSLASAKLPRAQMLGSNCVVTGRPLDTMASLPPNLTTVDPNPSKVLLLWLPYRPSHPCSVVSRLEDAKMAQTLATDIRKHPPAEVGRVPAQRFPASV